jgi:hypothetical protein
MCVDAHDFGQQQQQQQQATHMYLPGSRPAGSLRPPTRVRFRYTTSRPAAATRRRTCRQGSEWVRQLGRKKVATHQHHSPNARINGGIASSDCARLQAGMTYMP